MSKHFAISVLGKDRPGIVEAVSKVLFETGCNIEDSSMTILESEFAMILIIALDLNTSPNQLKTKLEATAKRMGLTVSLRALSGKEAVKEESYKNRYIISLYGSDKPGIVYKISSLLAKNRANISDVQTSKSGKGKNSVYVMLLETEFGSEKVAEKVKTRLQTIANALKVKISINPLETPEL